MFAHLAHMVAAQGETVQRMDADVEEAHVHVEKGHAELQRFWVSAAASRWFLVKAFALLVFFFVFFAYFFGRPA